MPERIGRYRIEKLVGEGGFGRVFLAYDEQLQRRVAIKTPHDHLISRPEDAELYLAEARTVASLDHPHIVPVYDVGQTDQYPCYLVSKYFEGMALSHRLREGPLRRSEAARLVATVAEALHYAHKCGVVHRDVKPGNILLDTHGQPYVADFGLALKDSDVGTGPRYCGTPAYMSPEQARGEGHRVDGRSDVYSLGAVLYKLLLGRRTFTAEFKGELLEQIANQEPRPPRQIDDTVPQELERICLKALSLRANERYTTALDMAADLHHFLQEARFDSGRPTESGSSWRETQSDPLVVHAPPGNSHPRSDSPPPIRIVPKGLHSFDEHDADFFLELLPGPRDREGLPDSVRFWKMQIEEFDADKTFPVGLIYGPSGCGKSSLVRAGLLPLLSEDIRTVYVESTAADTDTRLLNRLRKACHRLPEGLDLKESIAALRRGEGRLAGTKVLLILDQFEQWLHARRTEDNARLVQALRQCDGSGVQALVLVRDDFWMAITRFLDELDVGLVKGENVAAVDLFDAKHARRVLAAFGRAYGAIPENVKDLTENNRQFLDQAVSGLLVEGKVVCVRLALFAEMFKNRPWTPDMLRQVGGTTGIGVTFLEEAFSSATAVPKHRLHQQAAREVLKALLPETGSDIKGKLRSREELEFVSGYAGRRRELNELFHILDSELRLITPRDLEGVESSGDLSGNSSQPDNAGDRYYQLTHDYLVPSLRNWLTQKQKETSRGRAELRLADRAVLWSAKPENRHLPSLWEYLGIVALTSRTDWTEIQQHMMGRAKRMHLLRCLARCGLLLVLLLAILAVGHRIFDGQKRSQVTGLVSQLLSADTGEVPAIVASLSEASQLSVPYLSEVADDPGRPVSDRLRATLALADQPGKRATQLVKFSLTADPQTLGIVCQRLEPFADVLAADLWLQVRDEASPPSTRLRAAALLAVADRHGDGWEALAPTVVGSLLAESTLDLDSWISLLQPVAPALTPSLLERFSDTLATSSERTTSARALARYATPTLLGELLLEADSFQYAILFPAASGQRTAILDAARKGLGRRSTEASTDGERLRQARRQRNAAITLLRLDRADEIESLLSASADPTARTMLVLEMRDFGVSSVSLLRAFEQWSDPSARQAALLSLQAYRGQGLPPDVEQALTERLLGLLRDGPYQVERSAAEWLLRKWGQDENLAARIAEICQPNLPSAETLGDRDWWVTSQGHTMAILRGPIVFNCGSPPNEPGREDGEILTETRINRSIAVSVHEVTIEQYQRFEPNADFARDVADDPHCPANKVSFVDAMRYCRWLSDREGLTEEQVCYPPRDEIGPGDAVLSEDLLSRPGYRLLTEAEWEYVCRAGSTTRWHCGISEEHLRKFAWFALSADERLHPVGLLRPNQFGLFDTTGNVAEWCQPDVTTNSYALRGGSYDEPARRVRSAQRQSKDGVGYSFTGLRIARTIATDL